MDGLKDLGDKMTKHRYGHCLGADSGSILTHLKLGWKKVLEGELQAKGRPQTLEKEAAACGDHARRAGAGRLVSRPSAGDRACVHVRGSRTRAGESSHEAAGWTNA